MPRSSAEAAIQAVADLAEQWVDLAEENATQGRVIDRLELRVAELEAEVDELRSSGPGNE